MKKIKTLLIAIAFFSTLLAEGQTRSIRSAQQEPDWIPTNSSNSTSVNEAKDIVAQIISVVGLKANFQLRAANIPNAAAVIYDGKRYVIYNPTFISNINKSAGNKWAGISILAHEVGHHLNGHTLENIGSNPAIELEADEFSGFVLRRLGASLTDAQQAMRIAADYKQSATHPGKNDRLVAIANGWNNADNQAKGKYTDIAKTTAPVTMPKAQEPAITNGDYRTPSRTDDPYRSDPKTSTANTANRNGARSNDVNQNNGAYRTSSSESLLDERFILGDVSFVGDAGVNYYVTTRLNLVRIYNNEIMILGKIAPSNSNDYPYILTLVNHQKLYVSARGNILNSSGDKLGEMKTR